MIEIQNKSTLCFIELIQHDVVWVVEYSNLEFVSNFVLRFSDLSTLGLVFDFGSNIMRIMMVVVQNHSTKTTLMAPMPSPFPMTPSPSVVVALMLILPGDSSTA